MLRRLRIKFVVINMSVVSLLLVLIFVLFYGFTGYSMYEHSLTMMQDLAADPFRSPIGDMDRQVSLPYFVLQLSRGGEIAAVAGGLFDLSDEELIAGIVSQAMESKEAIGQVEGYSIMYYRELSPMSQRIVFLDVSSQRAAMQGLARTSVILGAVSFLAFLGLSLLLARWAVKPVDRAWRQQRQFVADASHELKTPLTVILANAQMLQQPDFDRAQQEQMAESIVTTSKQMRQLVEDMLDLARADSGQSKEEIKELDMSSLVADCVLPFEPVMFEKELDFDSQVEPGLRVEGREGQLKQLTNILLDNAAKYCLPGGKVSLSLSRQGRGHCALKVSNPSTPLSKEDCQDIFKRFYRTDQARSRDGSYGLGLSIAQAIVHDHKGKIGCEYMNGQAVFTALLPVKG